MYRDFSEKSKNELLGLVSEVENDKLSNFTDWIGDRWYDFESWIGKLNIRNYLNNVNEYHKKVIDKNNATKSSINVIFNNVKSVDTSYRETFTGKKSQLKQWQRYIDELNQIVNPRNGKFNPKAMSDALDGLLKQLSMDELNSSLEEYVELDKTTQKYTYHWNKIQDLLSQSKDELTEAEYMVLIAILNTMMNDEGYIDTESLQHFINLGYSTPSAVTSDDVHTSFYHSELAGHHSYVNYNYLQNKAYLNETFLTTVVLYDTIYQNTLSDSSSSNLNDLLKIIVKDYSVIEWRMRLNISHFDTKQDIWSGKTYVKDEALAYFNNNCIPQINIQYCNDKETKDGLMYYLIYSNAYDNGVETASGEPPYTITKDGIKHQDPTTKLYVNCGKDSNVDAHMLMLQGKSELSSFYQDYDLTSNIAKNIIEFAIGFIPGGEYINGAISLANSSEAIEQISDSMNMIKKTNLEELTKGTPGEISSKGEKAIDGGIDLVDKAAGIYVDYKKAELNNEKVDISKKTLEDLHNELSSLRNLGVCYDTVVVRYDEHEKSFKFDRDWNSYIDNKKESDSISEMNFMNYSFDRDLLLKEYNTTKKNAGETSVDASSEEFLELEKQVKEYFATGDIKGEYLSKYIERW